MQRDDAIVILPGQKPQGKADHAGLVAQHAFYRQISLAGVGGAENGDQAPFGSA